MDFIVAVIGAYIVWRLLAKDSGKPGQDDPTVLKPQLIEPASTTTPAPADIAPSVFLDQRKVSLTQRFDPLINDFAKRLNMDGNIIRALIYVQSGGDDAARMMQPDSEYGYGLTQITCARAKQLAGNSELGIPDITDCLTLEKPINSIYYGATYLNALFHGDWEDALAAYYSPTSNLLPTQSATEKAKLTLLIAQAWTRYKTR